MCGEDQPVHIGRFANELRTPQRRSRQIEGRAGFLLQGPCNRRVAQRCIGCAQIGEWQPHIDGRKDLLLSASLSMRSRSAACRWTT